MTEIEPEVLRRAQSGDREAHAVLYRAFAPMVYTLARRMLGSSAVAEDVLQDCFVEVIRKAGQFRGDGGVPVGLWIRQIAVNKSLSQLRSPWRRRRVEAASFEAQADERIEPGLAGIETGQAGFDGTRPTAPHTELERALGSLGSTARAVVWLYVVEGYTHDEIGRLMGRSTSFSKSQFARACQQLREELQPEVENEGIESCLNLLKPV
jgi:RNA polymerase sigma-70 factor (ECF subfamily)